MTSVGKDFNRQCDDGGSHESSPVQWQFHSQPLGKIYLRHIVNSTSKHKQKWDEQGELIHFPHPCHLILGRILPAAVCLALCCTLYCWRRKEVKEVKEGDQAHFG
jgi:hypothetical protein